MHIRCDYIDRCEIIGKKLVRTVAAVWDSKRHGHGRFDVYKIDADGKAKVRNLDFNCFSNYLFRNPKKCGIEKWGKPAINMTSFECGWSHKITVDEAELVKSAFPDFKWTLDKAIQRFDYITLAFAFRLLKEWKKNKNVEYLVNDGLVYLIFNDTFKKMSAKKQMGIVRFIKERLGGKDTPLKKVQMMMRLGISEQEYDSWMSYRPIGKLVGFTAYKYLSNLDRRRCKNRMEKIAYYIDYYEMAKKAGHDMNDRYWWNPKDLNKMHDKVMEECRLIDEARKIREAVEFAEKEQKKKADFEKAVKKFYKKILKKDKVEIFVPQTYEEVDVHAKKLHQCLIYADYVQRVIDKKCLLVFVKKNGKPNATAEINRDGTIGQFYADEQAKNIHPSETVRQLMDEWIEMYKPNLKRGRKAKEAA